MAIVKPSGIISDLNGKLNGSYFARSGNGTLALNTKPVPASSSSLTANLGARRMMYLIKRYKALTTAQKLQWTIFAEQNPINTDTGEPLYLSGMNLYLHLNETLRRNGLTLLTTPKRFVKFPAMSYSYVQNNATRTRIGFSPQPVPTGFNINMFASPPFLKGRKYKDHNWYYLGARPQGSTSSWVVVGNWIQRFGNPVPGTYVALKVYLINRSTGQSALPTFIGGINS